MSLSTILHGIQSGNDDDLDTARSLYIQISCVTARPLSFFACQGKAPRKILEILAGSCFTGDTVCRFANLYFSLKINLVVWKLCTTFMVVAILVWLSYYPVSCDQPQDLPTQWLHATTLMAIVWYITIYIIILKCFCLWNNTFT